VLSSAKSCSEVRRSCLLADMSSDQPHSLQTPSVTLDKLLQLYKLSAGFAAVLATAFRGDSMKCPWKHSPVSYQRTVIVLFLAHMAGSACLATWCCH
jgi:hypothetical protein